MIRRCQQGLMRLLGFGDERNEWLVDGPRRSTLLIVHDQVHILALPDAGHLGGWGYL